MILLQMSIVNAYSSMMKNFPCDWTQLIHLVFYKKAKKIVAIKE